MKKISISLIICCCVFNLFAQPEQRNWIFGRTNGINMENVNLDFFPGPGLAPYGPPVPLAMSSPPNSIGTTNGFEGWSVVSDPSTGDLLFYTDGRSVFDDTHTDVTIPLALGVDGLGASPSSSQPVVTCVVPICPFDQYYVFSNPTGKDPGGTTIGPITYHIYDAVLESFAGPFALPGIHGATNVGEGMIIVPSSDDPYTFFLITRLLNPVGVVGLDGDSKYVVYKIDPTGISYWSEADFGPGIGTDLTGASPIMNMAYSVNRDPDPATIGEAEVAFTASRIHSDSSNFVFTCGFNHQSGVGAFLTSSEMLIDNFTGEILYDCEYSPLGGFLYYASYFGSNLYQYNFATDNTFQVGGFGGGLRAGGLKIAPDGFVYHIQNSGTINNAGTVRIGRITSPDVALTTNFPGAPSTIYDNVNIISKAQTFAANFPEFVVTPLWNAEVTIVGEDTICPGEEVILSADIDALGASIEGYDWYYSNDGGATFNLLAGGGTYITVDQPGIYYLEVDLEGECSFPSSTVHIYEREDCCTITAASASTSYYTNTTISSDLAWDNKVYIADNVIITVENGATLDITNVDVIFGDCAGIDFVDGGNLRSNNSVYRPCNPNSVWRGLHFFQTSPLMDRISTGIVNESTFKNAQRALYVYNQSDIDLRITNNLFSNCKAGVDLNNGNMLRSITGNTFLIDDLAPVFTGTATDDLCAWGSTTEFFGILTNRVNFAENIAQNDFISPDFTEINYVGVEIRNGDNVVINTNRFTDLYTSIQLINSKRSLVESNTIYISNAFNNYKHQIAAINCANTLIRANDITSTIEQHKTEWFANNSAIYCSIGETYAIKENIIRGFEAGIQCERIQSSHITENDLSNCHYYGVYMNDSRSLNIYCNTINMDAQNEGDAIGIAYFQSTIGNNEIQIGSNCIFETNTAIYLQSASIDGILPHIENNFMYNYINSGIEIINFDGNIGSSPSPSLGAGRNTFVTNNGLGITGDIVTNTSLTSFGNFGVSFVSGSVAISGNSVNSTASCGSQIDLANSSTGSMEICDDLRQSIIKLVNEDNKLEKGFQQHLSNYSLEKIEYAMSQLYNGANEIEMIELYNIASTEMDLSENETLWLTFVYQILVKDVEAAEVTLGQITPNNQDETDYLFLEKMLIQLDKGEDLTTAEQIEELQAIVSRNGMFAHFATTIQVELELKEQYLYYPLEKATHLSTRNIVAVGDDLFNIYPNPATNQITFDYNFGHTSETQIEVYDFTGKKVNQLNINGQKGSQTVNISQLSKGMYMIVVKTNGEFIGHSKFVKK